MNKSHCAHARRALSRLTLTTALVAAAVCVSGPGAALAQDEEVEEIVVTGSYIRRSSFGSASPLAIVNQEDLVLEGKAAQLGDVAADLPFVLGQAFQTNILSTQNTGAASPINLRGLGEGATLTLVNGHRVQISGSPSQAAANVNVLAPSIAIDRVEILKDGASSLYGTDAVGGVVNFITRKNYEGFEFTANADTTTNNGKSLEQYSIEGLFGASTERTSVVGALSYFKRGRMQFSDRPFLTSDAFSLSTSGQPGTFIIPNRAPLDLNGDPISGFVDGNFVFEDAAARGLASAIPGVRNTADPECGNPAFGGVQELNDFGRPDVGRRDSFTSGVFEQANSLGGSFAFASDLDPRQVNRDNLGVIDRCRFIFIGDPLLSGEERFVGFMTLQQEISKYATLELEANLVRRKTKTDLTRSFPLGSIGAGTANEPQDRDFLIPGDAPGNPGNFSPVLDDNSRDFLFTSFAPGQLVDEVINATGAPGSDGIPDVDANGRQIVRRSFTRLVAQDADGDGVPDRDPATDQVIVAGTVAADGSVPAGTVLFNEDIPQASIRLIGNNVTNPFFPDSAEGETITDTPIYRFRANLYGDLGETDWTYDFNFSWSEINIISRSIPLASVTENTFLALIGEGGPDRDQFFNIFGSARAVNDEITTPDSPLFNDSDILQFVEQTDPDILKEELFVLDAVVSGPLFDLPQIGILGGRPLTAAFGGQWRREREKNDLGPLQNTGNDIFVPFESDRNFGRQVGAVFGETIWPLMSHDSYGDLEVQFALRYEDFGGGLNTWDPKAAFLYQNTIAGFGALSLRGSWGTSFKAPTLSEQFTPEDSDLDNLTDPINGDIQGKFLPVFFSGNPTLQPETATTWSAGFSYESEFIDGLLLEVDWWRFEFSDQIAQVNGREIIQEEFDTFLASGLTPAAFLATSPFSCRSEGQVNCIIRDNNGFVIGAQTAFINAASVETQGIDLHTRYRFDALDLGLPDIGNFVFDFNATWVDEFIVQEDPDGPAFDAAGKRNALTDLAFPTPHWRFNARGTWLYGNHRFSGVVRFFSEVENDSNGVATILGVIFGAPDIGPNATLDLQYTYILPPEWIGYASQTEVSIGSINVTDNGPTRLPQDFNGFDTFLEDPRGRRVYLTLRQVF